MKTVLVVPALVVLILSGCATLHPPATSGSRRPFVLMLSGGLVREGSLEECVYSHLREGTSISEAIDACKVDGITQRDGRWMEYGDLLGPKASGVSAASCPIADSDPKRSPAKGWADRMENILDMWKDKRDELIEEKGAAQSADQRAQVQGEIDAISKGLSDTWALWTDLVNAGKQAEEATPSPAGDYPVPDPGDPGTARTGGETESMCEKVSTFIGECNRDGWTSPECEELKRRMDGCADPKVADPVPGEQPECGLPAVDPGKVQDVLLFLCTSKKQYGPGENPCDEKLVKGEARRYFYGRGGKVNPCEDPAVRTTGEDCLPTFTFVEFGGTDLEEIARFGLEKLGGPILVIPTGEPRDDTTPAPKPPPF